MNSLLNYGSDDDCEDSGDEKFTDTRGGANTRNYRKTGASTQEDANYDEVGMDMSEDSDRDPEEREKDKDRDSHRIEKRHERDRNRESSRNSPKSRNDRRNSKERDRDRCSGRDRDEDRWRNRREDKDRDEDRGKNRSRDERDEDRKDRYRDDRRDRRDERSSRDDKYRDRDRKERRRSKSKDTRRSRSPRRSRSKSKERGGPRQFYSRNYERANNKMDKLDKMGIEIKTPDCQYVTPADLKNSMHDEKGENKDRFFMPGITGRFRDQIERRKMLWQKGKEPEKKAETVTAPQLPIGGPGGSRTTKVWEATTFADDKTSSKFKRLMGIKESGDSGKNATEVLKKQEEMFTSMEQQYEVARTATHTMRGVGLGFGSFQR